MHTVCPSARYYIAPPPATLNVLTPATIAAQGEPTTSPDIALDFTILNGTADDPTSSSPTSREPTTSLSAPSPLDLDLDIVASSPTTSTAEPTTSPDIAQDVTLDIVATSPVYDLAPIH